MLYVAVVIRIYCKRMFQLFYLVSVCCSRCCSPRALTREHARAARTHLALPTSVMHVSTSSRTCTQRVVSAQMVEHSLVKVHARMPSARAGQHPMDTEPGSLHQQAWSPTVEHAADPPQWSVQPGSTRVCGLCSTLSLACSRMGLTHMLSYAGAAVACAGREARGQAQQQHARTQK